MQTTGVIIQARLGSTRLSKKVILPFHNGKTILDIIIEKIIKKFDTSSVCLATSKNPENDILGNISRNYGIRFFRGEENNVLDRFIKAAEKFNFQNIIRICADNPFLDVDSLFPLVDLHLKEGNDYTSYEIIQGKPIILSHIGFFGEVVRLASLKKVTELTKDIKFLEHVTNFIYQNPDLFKTRFLPAPSPVFGRTDIRLTIDTVEDLKIASKVYSELFEVNRLTMKDVINYIDDRQELIAAMKKEMERNEK